jgi:PAS domain S-box-containing protein
LTSTEPRDRPQSRAHAGRAVRRVGMRREVELFLPFAALVLIGLCVATLLIHRSAVHGLIEDRRDAALRAVARLQSDLAAGGPVDTVLREHARGDVAVAVLEPDGRVRWSAGPALEGDPLAPLPAAERGRLTAPRVLGPDRASSGAMVAFAPLELDGRPRLVRRAEPARRLAALAAALPLLTVTVAGASLALLVLVGLYLRHLLRPFELLLDRARQVAGESAGEDDDIAWILSSFDRALEALHGRGSPDGDLAALERALTQVQSGLLLLDAEGRLLALNESGARLLGVTEEVAGRSLADVLAPHPELLRRLREAIESGASVQRAEIAVAVAGSERVVGLTLHPLRRDDVRVRGWLGLFADLTESRRLARSRQLNESLERIGELTAGLAHELRNGLATVRGHLTLAERALGQDDRRSATDSLLEIRQEVDDLHRVAEDFLDFARPGSIRPEVLQPERLARRAAADPALGGAAVQVEIDPGAARLEVHGDPHLVGRALRNLLDNAVRAQREAGVAEPVRLLVERDDEGDGRLRLRVIDRGPGLAPDVRDRLFVPFATARTGGSGLGLALAHRIARLHGGAVEVREPEEGGVEATLVLPTGAIVTGGNDPASHLVSASARRAP